MSVETGAWSTECKRILGQVWAWSNPLVWTSNAHQVGEWVAIYHESTKREQIGNADIEI